MKKLLIILAILLPITASAVWYNPFTYFDKPEPPEITVGVSDGTITRLDQWASTSTPQTSITQRVMNSVLRFTGLSGCLQADANGIITGTGSACGSGGGTSAYEIATTTDIAVPNVAYFTQTGGRTTLGSVATGTISVPTGLTITANRYALGGSTAIGLDTGYVIPLQSTLDAKAEDATTITIAGTANQITSSAGAQDLSTNRTWTLSVPSQFNIQQASTTLLSANRAWFGGTATTTIANDGSLSVASTSGMARLSVQGAGATSATYGLAVANSASTPILITRDDVMVMIGTTTPLSARSLLTVESTVTHTTAASVRNSMTTTANPASNSSAPFQSFLVTMDSYEGGSVNFTSALTSLNAQSLHRGSGVVTTNLAGAYIAGNSGAGNITNSYAVRSTVQNTGSGTTANGIGFLALAPTVSAGSMTKYTGIQVDAPTAAVTNYAATLNGIVGVGTTTPVYTLTISSSTASQLALSAGAGVAQWAMRNAGGNLYFSTTTVAGTATTSVAAFEIRNDGSAYAPFTSTSGSAQTGYWCYDTSGQLIRTTTTCLVSALKYKKDVSKLDMGLKEVLDLEPVSYFWKDESWGEEEQIGFIAEQAETVDKRLVNYDENGEIRSFNYQQYTSVLTKAIQELDKKITTSKRTAEENWQWLVIGVMFLWIIRLEIKLWNKK